MLLFLIGIISKQDYLDINKLRNFRKILTILGLTLILYSCKEKYNESDKNLIWEKFKTKIENNDLEYLIENSQDSIKCIDCVPNETEKLYLSKFIFENYRDEFYNVDILKNKVYSTFKNDTIIRINYSFENKFGDESYNIIYMFDKKENSFLLTGMITLP